MTQHRRTVILGVILVVAGGLRVYGAFIAPPHEALSLAGDQRAYDEIGWNLAQGMGFGRVRDGVLRPTASLASPLYPFFVAGVYAVAGHRPEAVRFVQCWLGVGLCWMLYRLGSRLFGREAGLLTSALAAGYPLLVRHSYFGGPAYLLSENLTVPLTALLVWSLVELMRRPTLTRQVAAGVCLGLSILARATWLLFPLALFAWFAALRRWSWGALARMTTVVLLVMGLTLAPWVWRNYHVFHRFVPVSTQGGKIFWTGNNPHARGGWGRQPLPERYRVDQDDEVAYDRAGFQAGWESLWRDPARVPWLLWRKALVFWMYFDETATRRINWPFLVTALWALVGWWLVRRQPACWLPIIVPCAYLTGIALAFYGDPRFRAPLEPLLLLLAAAGLWWALQRLGTRLRGVS
jgi:4-amino-4-deoxy-L-arabinose transferase-like glycosyltransferase